MATDATTLISVVMPAFNAEKTLEQSIRSVLQQKHQNLELIVVDDASIDATYAIARELAQKDARVKVYKNVQNLGVSETRKKGIAKASAEWIALLDSDDMWDAYKLEKQCEKMKAYPECPFFFTGSAFVDEDNQPSKYTLHVPEQMTYRALLRQNLISCSSVLIRKELLETFPMPKDPMLHEDYAAWLQILRTIPYAVGIDEPLLIYRLDKNSKSGNKRKAARMQWRTYQYVGLPFFQTAVFFASYALRSLKKYTSIHRGMWENGER